MSRGGALKDLINRLAEQLYHYLLGQLTTPAGGIGIVEDINGTGYSVAEDRMENVAKLNALGIEAVSNPLFAPSGGTTHCNQAARFIAEGMGFYGFPRNALADGMIDFMAASPSWREDTIERAFEAAMRGGLAFIAFSEHPHGHIVAVAPEPMQHSDLWGSDEPMVFNVGRSVGLMKLSDAFPLADRAGLRAFILEASVA